VIFSFFVFARFLQASLYIGKTGVIFFKKGECLCQTGFF